MDSRNINGTGYYSQGNTSSSSTGYYTQPTTTYSSYTPGYQANASVSTTTHSFFSPAHGHYRQQQETYYASPECCRVL